MPAWMKNRTLWIAIVVALVAGLVLGRLTGGGGGGEDEHAQHGAAEAATTVWTCSMHPQIQQPEPGDCPICGMDLIPLAEDAGGPVGPRDLRLSETARQLARIQVQPVERRLVEREVRMAGKVTYDETRLATITAWVGGRLDRLFVDYTGIPVDEGDHMVWMYSPAILAAQEELIQAGRAVSQLRENGPEIVADSVRATLEATRDKLRLWGLTAEQIAEIEARGSASDHIQINAPIGGIVVHKNAQEGEYVQVGTPIYRIADLKQVWVLLDAYESDLAWLRPGQEVRFTAEAFPSESFSGRISFIDPVLTTGTRTVKVRVNVPNEAGKLKPGMFVRGIVQAQVAASGRVIDDSLAGKWIGPMHPEIVRDEPGDCPICGMPLKKAEALGYVTEAEATGEVPLVIPVSAPLITGKRAVVYVQSPDDPSIFTGREVVLGPRAGDWYIVDEGLAEGERVVMNGAFKIDSALQIQAKPSMMSPAEEAVAAPAEPLQVDAAFRQALAPLFDAYLQLQQGLADDDLAAAKVPAGALAEAVQAMDASSLRGDAMGAWMEARRSLTKSATAIAGADEIAAARVAFNDLSERMIGMARRFGSPYAEELLVMHCPMAFDDQGADWLQLEPTLANPYFGDMMLRCGEITERIAPVAGEAEEAAVPPAFTEALNALLDAYLGTQQALSLDKHEDAVSAAEGFLAALRGVPMAELPGPLHDRWMPLARELQSSAEGVVAGEEIEASRKAFSPLSESMIAAVQRFGQGLPRAVYQLQCPMAFNDQGAIWLQSRPEVENPYFGDMMYRCGEVQETLVEAPQ